MNQSNENKKVIKAIKNINYYKILFFYNMYEIISEKIFQPPSRL